jgi:NADH-ubiquinone oxidoreductase chain 5
MGGLIKFLPFTYSAMLAGSLSLLATPFLTAFYSKDLILELAYGSYSFSGTYAFVLGTVTAGITAFYSVRLLSLVFFTVPNGSKVNYANTHETKLAVIIPFIILALFSIFFGYVASDLFVGVGSDFLGNSVFMHPNNVSIIEAEFSLSPIIKLLP